MSNCFAITINKSFRLSRELFTKHQSYVYYKEAVVYKVDLLRQRIEEGEVVIQEDVTEEVFERIIDGFRTSEFVNRQTIKALKEAGILQK